jgi:hypothetical protein
MAAHLDAGDRACGFLAPTRFASAAVRTLLVRDINGDGAPDIIASGNQVDELNAFSLFLNRGDGTFEPERLIPTGFGQRIEDAGDFNGDGSVDLLASDYWSLGIVLYEGPTFAVTRPYVTATHGGPSFAIDFDGDGKQDVVSLSVGSGNPLRAHFFRGNGDGTLAPKTTFETGFGNVATPSRRMINGALEILIGERSNRLGILHYANGNLSVSSLPVGPGLNFANTFGDVNGDGVADVIDTTDAEGPNESVFVALGNTDGTFGERRQLTTPRSMELPVAVRVLDFDLDGRADLIVQDVGASHLQWFRGDGKGNFSAPLSIDAGGIVNAFAIADVDADGRPDLIVTNDDHMISIVINARPCAPRRHAASH